MFAEFQVCITSRLATRRDANKYLGIHKYTSEIRNILGRLLISRGFRKIKNPMADKKFVFGNLWMLEIVTQSCGFFQRKILKKRKWKTKGNKKSHAQ